MSGAAARTGNDNKKQIKKINIYIKNGITVRNW